jgi:hypothetical protein
MQPTLVVDCYRPQSRHVTDVDNRAYRHPGLPTVGPMSAVRVPTSVPTGADRHPQVPTCTDRGCRGRGLRGAVPPVPRGFVGTKFAVQGYSEGAQGYQQSPPLFLKSFRPATPMFTFPSILNRKVLGGTTGPPPVLEEVLGWRQPCTPSLFNQEGAQGYHQPLPNKRKKSGRRDPCAPSLFELGRCSGVPTVPPLFRKRNRALRPPAPSVLYHKGARRYNVPICPRC